MLTVALCVGATQDPGGALAGRVVDAAREPVAGAVVVLMHRPIPWLFESPAVRREVTTDARGMFRVELLGDRVLSVWASWPDGVTSVAEGVTTRGWVELVEDRAARRTRVTVTGAAAWAEYGPLVYRVPVGSENLDLIALECKGDELSIPRLPTMVRRVVEVVGRDGQVLWAAAPKARRGGGMLLELPPLVDVEARVLDTTASPVAGVEIRRWLGAHRFAQRSAVALGDRFRALWPVVATTDREGRATMRLPLPDNHYPLHLMARHRGFKVAVSGRYGDRSYSNGEFTGESDTVQFQLAKAAPVRAVIRVAGAPYRGAIALVWHVAVGATRTSLPFPEPLFEVTDGEISCLSMPKGSALDRGWAVLPEAVRRDIEAKLGAAPPVTCALTDVASVSDGGAAAKLVVPDSYRLVQIATPEGLPAQGATVLVAPIRDGQPSYREVVFARADRVGRAVVRVTPRDDYLLAVTATAWAGCELAPGDAAERRVLNLAARPVIAGRIVDGRGAPFAGVLVETTSYRGDHRAHEDEIVPTAVAGPLFQLLGPVTSDADGRFRLPVLPAYGAVGIQARVPGRPLLTSPAQWFNCVPGEEDPVPVVIRVARDR